MVLDIKYFTFYFNTLLLFLWPFVSDAQKPDYFAPLGEITPVSSLVGEIRPDHYHTGIDFGTYSKTGLKVYAIDSGWISRIRVSGYGYGKVLYIAHADGRESVYAHLDDFSDAISAEFRKWCYAYQMADAEVYLAPGVFKVSRGEVIGFSGNTGRSYAPHLHFEIRDMATEQPLQVWNYAFAPKDKTKPVISAVSVFQVSDLYTYSQISRFSSISNSKYKAPSSVIINQCNGKIGIGADAFDLVDNSGKDLNVNCFELWVNNKLVYEISFDSVSFDDVRKINAAIDLDAYKKERRKTNLLFHSPFVKMRNVKSDAFGLIDVEANTKYDIKIVAADVGGNATEIAFQLVVKNVTKPNTPDLSLYCHPDSIFKQNNENFSIYMPAGTLYNPVKPEILVRKLAANSVSDKIIFLQNKIPLNNSYSLGLKLNPAYAHLSHKVYMREPVVNKKFRTQYLNGFCYAQVNTGGEFVLAIDTIAPNIKYMNNLRLVSGKYIADFIIGDAASGLAEYHAFINDSWTLCEFDGKNNKLTVEIPASDANKMLNIVVYDGVYNKATKSVPIRLK